MKVLQIIKKDLKILIRSRFSASIVLIGPLLIVLMVGLAFNSSSVNNIKIGTYSSNYSELSDNLISALKDQQYSVVKMNDEKGCIESIKTGSNHVCMIIPPDLKVSNNQTNQSKEIIFYVDTSRINLVYLVINEISKKVLVESKELSKGLTQNILDVLQNSRVKLIENQNAISSLSSSNSEIGNKADTISSNLDSFSLNLNTSDLGVDLLKNGSISCGSNCSSDYTSKVNNIISKLENLGAEVSKANSAKDSIKQSVVVIKEKNSGSSSNINTLDTNVKDIISRINGIQVTEAESIVNPIKTSVKPISNSQSNLSFLFPTLVALVIMFVSLLLSSTIVIREKRTRAYFRNFITPTNNFTFIMGTFLTILLILVVQLLIIFGQGFFVQNVQIASSIFSLLLILFIIATTFILFGMFIGQAFQSEETVTLASMSTAALFLFISNTIFPIETIPAQLKWLALFNPFVIADSLLKKLLLFNASIGSLLTELYLLIAYIILLTTLVYLTRELNKRKLA